MADFVTPEKAAEYILAGKLVAFPTETVYGIGADALNEKAVKRIYEVKKRNQANPLICHLHSAEAVFRFGTKSDLAEKLSRYWPGPLTLILPHEGRIPDCATAGSPLCAFRVPDHPDALKLLSLVNRPVAAPSANLSGRRSPVTAEMVQEQLGESIDGILDGGRCRVGIESTVILIQGNELEILRHGSITEEFLRSEGFAISPSRDNSGKSVSNLQSPGLERVHYRPSVPLIWLDDAGRSPIPPEHSSEALKNCPFRKPGLITFSRKKLDLPHLDQNEIFDLSPDGDLKEAAKNLYHVFNMLGSRKIDAVYAIPLPDRDEGRAVNDRMRRASSFVIRFENDKYYIYSAT